MTKIVQIEKVKICIFKKNLMNFSEIFRENVTYDDIKSDSPIKM